MTDKLTDKEYLQELKAQLELQESHHVKVKARLKKEITRIESKLKREKSPKIGQIRAKKPRKSGKTAPPQGTPQGV
jgi:hypothetical protein